MEGNKRQRQRTMVIDDFKEGTHMRKWKQCLYKIIRDRRRSKDKEIWLLMTSKKLIWENESDAYLWHEIRWDMIWENEVEILGQVIGFER